MKKTIVLSTMMLVFVVANAQRNPATVNFKLSWEVASTANTAIYRAEHYGVFASTTGTNPADFTMLFEETLSTEIPNWQPQPREIDLDNYGGQAIYLAFRHFNVYDMDRVVIDNVKIRIVQAGQPDVVLLNEDFQSGINNPAGEEWMPEGWTKLDADGDNRNWYFAVRQGNATMRSQSYDGTPLTPNNWLFTPQVYIGFVGAAENHAPDVTIYPNPASNFIQIDSRNALHQVVISDLRGRIVFSGSANGNHSRIAIDHLPVGFYLLRLMTNEGTVEKKIQIRR